MARAGGAKLNRTETVTVRLDPKLNYLCELASRAQRRTKSSFVEWAVAEALKAVELPEITDYDKGFDGRPVAIHDKSGELWQVDEADRLVALALIAPSLLTHDEQLIWKLIRENGYLWRGNYRTGEWSWEIKPSSLIRDRLRENWDVFKSVVAGEQPKDALPTWSKTDPDDIPF